MLSNSTSVLSVHCTLGCFYLAMFFISSANLTGSSTPYSKTSESILDVNKWIPIQRYQFLVENSGFKLGLPLEAIIAG